MCGHLTVPLAACSLSVTANVGARVLSPPGRLWQIARRLDMHPADLVPELDAAVTPAARPPPTPAAARTGEPTPSPCRPRSPPPGPAPRRPAHPRPWNGGCRAPQPPMPPPRTTRPRRPAGAAPHPARNLDRHTPPGHPHPGAAPRPAPSHRRRHPRRRPARVPAAGQSGTYADLRAQPGWAAAETELQETGLSYSINGPDEVHVGDDDKIQPPLQRRRPHRPRARRAPLRWTSPQHIRPEVPRPGRVSASEHPGGPGSHSPARAGPGSGRAGFGPPSRGRRGPEAHMGPARAGPRVGRGPITTDARPVRQPGTMNAAPGEPQRARNLSGCQDQPPDLLLLWRRGAVAVMSAS